MSQSLAIAFPPGGVLSLDLSGIVGWAYGRPFDPRPWFGRLLLARDGGEGLRYMSLENELIFWFNRFRPGQVVLEQHLPLPAMNNVFAARQAFGLRAFVYSEAARKSCPIYEQDVRTVRADVLGRSYFPGGSKEIKREVVRWCIEQGWHVPDHNAGDACVLWEWYRRRLRNETDALRPLVLTTQVRKVDRRSRLPSVP